ncbi:VMAP-C domain-containing protein [Streptomyces xiamenensis]|uniref:Pbs lyase n=1 Tax=Streptomyces xiamenensis TaxID=408015 RepID=A0A0F7FXL6_9ACTN|nr:MULTISPECIES: trypsin-like peptidase domain-containing protein [Streptomyces]AKG45412.1 pbs lyase [Streptomyces xiamenensis]
MSPYDSTGGAQGEDVPRIETLFRLLSSATVRIHAAPEGYAEGVSGATPWGSGFFVAPGWVLTCAHVALRGGSGEGGKREVGLSFEEMGDGGATATHTVRGIVEWAQPEHSPAGDIWPGPDLALVRVLNPPPHPCVWLSERTARFTLQDVYFFGWGQLAGSASPVGPVDGRCTVTGQYGADGWLKLGNQDEIPHGVSGGPVVDLNRGEVIGVVKASRSAGRDGGLATSILQLRHITQPSGTLAAETEDTYQHVMHAHDRYHAQRHRDDETTRDTWTDLQGPLRATAHRALTAGRRAELLGLLAELPPPLSTARLGEIIGDIAGRRYDDILPAPRGWRDGLGMLYDPRPGLRELDAVLRYAVYAATADRPYAAPRGSERRLWEWISSTAAGAELDRWSRRRLREEWTERLSTRRAWQHDPWPAEIGPHTTAATVLPDPADDAPRPYVLLEIVQQGWERNRYDWRVCVTGPTGERTPIDGEDRVLGPGEPSARLRSVLTEAFRRGDEPGRPVPLQVSLPYPLLDFPVDEWRLPYDGPQLGEQRPVVVRCADRPSPAPDPDTGHEHGLTRETRWAAVHSGPMRPHVLDCADHRPAPLPTPAALAGRPPETVPVLCRTGAPDGDPRDLHQVLAAGYDVVLWRREISARELTCTDFHGGVTRTVTGVRRAAALPTALWRLRAQAAAEAPEAEWSRGLALLYSDPGHAGYDEPLEIP